MTSLVLSQEKEKMGRGEEREQKLLFIFVIGILSLLISIYLVKDHIEDNDESYCDVNSHISCSKVRRSIFSELFNVPVALFGVLYNLITVSLALRGYIESSNQIYVNGLFYWSVFGTLFVFYLITAEIILQAICPLCTLIHIFQFIVLFQTWKIYNSQPQTLSFFHTLISLKYWIIIIGLLNFIPIIYFNFIIDPTEDLQQTNNIIHHSSSALQSFTQCINANGWKFYGRTGCVWCDKQKQMLGDSLQFIQYVDCADAFKICRELDITGFPSWIQFAENGDELERWVGYATIETLSQLTGCPIPQEFLQE